MKYEILEVHCKYENGNLIELVVLWVSNKESDLVRASLATNKSYAGYGYLGPNEILSEELIQKTAGTGIDLSSSKGEKIFSGKYKWEN